MIVPNGEPPADPPPPCPEIARDKDGYTQTALDHCEWKVIHATDAPPVEIIPIFGLVEVSVNYMLPFDLLCPVICSGHVQVHGKQDGSCIKYKKLM